MQNTSYMRKKKKLKTKIPFPRKLSQLTPEKRVKDAKEYRFS